MEAEMRLNIFLIIIMVVVLMAGCLRKQDPVTPADYSMLPGTFVPVAGDYEKQCGPVAEYQALKYLGYAWTLEQVSEAMDWNSAAGNLTDTHLNHIRMLKRFSVPYSMKLDGDPGDISKALRAGFPVVILLKLKNFLNFHWVVCVGIMPDGVIVSWGDGALVTIPLNNFPDIFTGSMITVGAKL